VEENGWVALPPLVFGVWNWSYLPISASLFDDETHAQFLIHNPSLFQCVKILSLRAKFMTGQLKKIKN
jgi:hypothetical protein